MLTWNLDCTPVEVSKERAELLQVRSLLPGVDGGEQEVSEVLESEESLQNAWLSGAIVEEVSSEAWS